MIEVFKITHDLYYPEAR